MTTEQVWVLLIVWTVAILALAYVRRPRSGATVEFDTEAPSWQETQKQKRKKPADPLHVAYTDAKRLCTLAFDGTPLTRRQAAQHPRWNNYSWRQAYRFARKAKVLDRDQRILVDTWEECETLLREEWSRQGELRHQGRWVSA